MQLHYKSITRTALYCSLLVPLCLSSAYATESGNAVNTTNTHQILNQSQQPPVSVYFLNGIFNTDIQSQTSAIALFERLKNNPDFLQLVNNQQVHLRTLYNPTDPYMGDIYELSAQAGIQKEALAATEARLAEENQNNQYDAADLEILRRAIFNQEIHKANQAYQAQDYSSFNFIHKAGNRAIGHYQMLAKEVKKSLLAGEKVVIVAHSQGNYVVQGIYAQLAQDPQVSTHLANNLSVVGVANVAATTPSASYITNKDDLAVYRWHTKQGGNPMTANFNAIFANGESLSAYFWESAVQKQNDSQNHGFIETYLSARFNTNQEFTPHQPEIIAKETQNDATPKTIYGNIVTRVMNGIETIFSAS
ncbi:hypothetical protein [Psychrobacter sp. I-STPA6b]|uniref:hypothetical protein n=1 Tax=Psychrobacter sp. I-STPA6b TaxID=2585718 RepID=UPI001D0BF5BC|nr:hypothetical protein [Psychrobacter sp. I-STPA6b]